MLRKVPGSVLGRVTSALAMSLLLGGSLAAASECVDVQPPSTGFGFFRRQVTCSQVLERGDCEENVARGYCLLTCEACVVAEPVGEEPSLLAGVPMMEDMATPTSEELDPEAAAAAAYQAELLEQVAIMEDGTGDVEELPSLVYDRDLPPTPATETGTVSNVTSALDAAAAPAPEAPMAEAPVAEAPAPEAPAPEAPAPEAPAPEPLCDPRSALGVITAKNLTTLSQVADYLNIVSVLNDTSISFTLFAPSNDAWDEAFPDLDEQLADVESTKAYLFSHIIGDQMLESLADGTITPISGAVLFVREDGTQIISRAATADIIETIVGCNWVVHIIDNVLGEGDAGTEVNPDFRQILQG